MGVGKVARALRPENVKDTIWKWRHRAMPTKDKTLSDFSSGDSALPNEKSSKTNPNAPTKEPGFGSSATVKMLYEGKNNPGPDKYIDWQDWPPREISKAVAKVHDRVAMKLYMVKDKDKPAISGRFIMKHHQLDIQNPLLIEALAPILKEEGMHLSLNETASFYEPFQHLYFRYDAIRAKTASLAETDPLREFMLLLIKVLDEMFAEVRSQTKSLREKGLISYKHAWSYFPRGSTIVSHGPACDLLRKVDSVSYSTQPPFMTVQAKSLHFNGNAFVWEKSSVKILPFNGNQPITDLNDYPLEFDDKAEELRNNMRRRGEMVLDYQTLTYSTYTGIGLVSRPDGIEKHNVDCRILIDVVGYNKHHLVNPKENKDPQTARNTVKGTGRKTSPITSSENNITSIQRLTDDEQKTNKEVMLARPNDLIFISPLLEGYALKNKQWMRFLVEDIRPMVWNDTAFSHLVYDEQQKDLVMSFVESHGRTQSDVADVIIGKGSGLILLLSGPPGTGKTLLAESIADKSQKPLFYLQAEDLGINAAALGENIKKVFEMATEWDAVILLDEADVFMAERHPQDIARNELVSIFLRELEYFRGIIFLTTNLYDTIDSAFRSRVSLHLLFKPLMPDARLVVWRKFLDRLPAASTTRRIAAEADEGGELEGDDVGLSESDLKELSLWNMNGREIKTAVKMVKQWCDHKGYGMTLERLENGIRATSPHASKLSEDATDLYD